TELYRRSPAGAPDTTIKAVPQVIDSVLQERFGAGTVSNIVIGNTPQFNLGNSTLRPESAVSYEVGYRGSISNDLFVTVDAYFNRRSDFISASLPGVTPHIYMPIRTNSGNAAADAVGDSILLASIGQAR